MTSSLTAEPGRTPSRLAGIEAGRFVLCYAVILLHVVDPPTTSWQWLTVAACNAAVPFFFITSGYFNRIDPTSAFSAIFVPAGRLCAIYIVWLTIYYAWFALMNGARPAFDARDLVDGGLAYHLWFLPALAFASVLVGLGFKLGLPRATTAACVLLALFALLPRLFEHAVPTFPGGRALGAPLYFVGGKLLGRRSFTPRPLPALIAAISFWLIAFADAGLTFHLARQLVTLHSAPVMTYGLGFAVFAFARSLQGSRSVQSIAVLGGVSLGIYSVHLLMVLIVMPNASSALASVVFARAALVLALSTVVAAAIATIPICWRLASHRRQNLLRALVR